MNIKIDIGKKTIFGFVILFLGIFFSVSGGSAYFKYRNATDLNALYPQTCKEGTYVKGYIEEYIGKRFKTSRDPSYTGVSGEWLLGGKTASKYTIYLEQVDRYICCWVVEPDTKNVLSSFQKGKGKCYIEGEIRRPMDEVNYAWYVPTDDQELSHTVEKEEIFADFIIFECDIKSNSNVFVTGILFLLIALYLLKGTNFKRLIMKEDLPPEKVDVLPNHNEENEEQIRIQRRIYRYERIRSEKRSAMIKIPVFFLGVWFYFIGQLWVEFAISAALIIFCIKNWYRNFRVIKTLKRENEK